MADFVARERDWRIGPVVYQVFPDRFAASKGMRSNLPKRRAFDAERGYWAHELDFWGGDLAGLAQRLDHILGIGADVLYLNPIVPSHANHRYDALDHAAVDPRLGTRADVMDLAERLHRNGRRLVLDGVFNHMAADAPFAAWFLPTRWANSPSLAELDLDREDVRAALWEGEDSVVRRWLAEGIDGWRLDVAFDLGVEHLKSLREHARKTRPDAWIIGEIMTYPNFWDRCVDGIYNRFLGRMVLDLAQGLPAERASAWLRDLLADADPEFLLRSWIVLDSHDTPRLAHVLPDPAVRRLALDLQYALPGSPVLYYGTEVGLEGGGDPENRAPMPWDRVDQGHPELEAMRARITARRQLRALRIGDTRVLDAGRCFAFARLTDRARETVFVAANPTGRAVRCTIPVRDGRALNGARYRDVLGNAEAVVGDGILHAALGPRQTAWFALEAPQPGRYSMYKRLESA